VRVDGAVLLSESYGEVEILQFLWNNVREVFFTSGNA
jgi:hypothetical protein